MGRIRESTLVPTAQNRANAAASNRANWEGDYGDEVWALDPIDLMSVEEFELHLVRKFGPEYLEPINYAWQGGEFLPCTAVTSRPQQGEAAGSSLPGPSELTTVG